jgi:hypothetical protein
MKRKVFYIVLFQAVLIIVLSCTERSGFNEMTFLIGDYYREKLSLIKINEKKPIREELILDLTELRGKRIIQAGFLELNTVYVVSEGIGEKLVDERVYIRLYDTITSEWKDIYTFKVIFDNIRIIDVENSGGYFSGYVKRNVLTHLDFNYQTSSTIYTFSEGEEIVTINCRFADSFISINTYKEKENAFHYYLIDKYSYEKVTEGIGQLYVNKYGDTVVCEKDAKMYILDNLFDPIKEVEIPVGKKGTFFKAVAVDKNSFILCFYSTSPNYLGNFLFGGEHVFKHYKYWLFRILDEEKTHFEYEKIYKYWNNFNNKILFDVSVSEDFE